jgi:hypothetical protein
VVAKFEGKNLLEEIYLNGKVILKDVIKRGGKI